jgi:hypothetical protein
VARRGRERESGLRAMAGCGACVNLWHEVRLGRLRALRRS